MGVQMYQMQGSRGEWQSWAEQAHSHGEDGLHSKELWELAAQRAKAGPKQHTDAPFHRLAGGHLNENASSIYLFKLRSHTAEKIHWMQKNSRKDNCKNDENRLAIDEKSLKNF